MAKVCHSPSEAEGSLQRYMKELAASEPLSTEEEVTLARRIKKGDIDARDKLVEANLKFVITVAQKYRNRGMPLVDLVSVGNIGLIKAAERFDETKGVKFISYAVWWIRQSIYHALEKYSRLVRLPANRFSLLRRISWYIRTRRDFFCWPTAEEIAEELGVSVEHVIDTMAKGQDILSLDTPFRDDFHTTSRGDDESNLLKTIPDSNQESPDTQAIRHSLQDEIETALNGLEAREREVIKLYFGLGKTREMTLEEIGKQLNITRARVRQIKEKALSKLRHAAPARRLIPYAE